MKKISTCYKDILKSMMSQKRYVTGLCLIIFITYGLFIVSPKVSYDFSIYKEASSFVGLTYFFMNRWGHLLVTSLFFWKYVPFWTNAIGALLLFAVAVGWCTLWAKISRSFKLEISTFVFASLFVTYPLYNELLGYAQAIPSYFALLGLISVSLCCVHSFFEDKKKVLLVLAVIACAFAIAIIQQAAQIYLVAMFAVVWMEHLNGHCEKMVDVIIRCLIYSFVLAVGIVLWAIIAFMPLYVCNALLFEIPPSGGAHDSIYWVTGALPFFERCVGLFKGLVYHLGYNAFFIEALRYFWFSIGALLSVGVYLTIKRTTMVHLFLALGLILSNFSLAIVQGCPPFWRNCTSFGLTIAFTWMLILKLTENRKNMHYLGVVIALLLIFWQLRDLSLWFYNDYRRFQMDKHHALILANDISRVCGANVKKPVALIGNPVKFYHTLMKERHDFDYMPKLYPIVRTNGKSIIHGEGVRREKYLLIREVACIEYVFPSEIQFQEASIRIKTTQQPSWPFEGYVQQYDDMVVVNLGDPNDGDQAVPSRENFLSPNEKLMYSKLGITKIRKEMISFGHRICSWANTPVLDEFVR